MALGSLYAQVKMLCYSGFSAMETIFDDRAMIITTDDKTLLLITDLHLGFEFELYESKGISFPPQHEKMRERLSLLIEKHAVSELYVVGDVKHTISVHSHFNWSIVPEFMFHLSNLTPTFVIPGNHDGDLLPLLPRSVTVLDVRGIVVGNDDRVGLSHGHAWPSPDLLDTQMIITGHNHPTLRNVRAVDAPDLDRAERKRFAGIIPVVLKSQLDKNCVRRELGVLERPEDKRGTLITLPSFNEMFAGIQINTPKGSFQGPLFENGCAGLIQSEVYSITGVYLGTVEELRERFNEIIK
ncbi:MAG: metallophosphoesterase [Candidatus Thorarchaeota archaeon]